MRRSALLFAAAAVIGAVDAALALGTFEKKRKHEAMQSAIRAVRNGPQVKTEKPAPAQDTPDEKKSRRTFNEWMDAFRDRHYIELDIDGQGR